SRSELPRRRSVTCIMGSQRRSPRTGFSAAPCLPCAISERETHSRRRTYGPFVRRREYHRSIFARFSAAGRRVTSASERHFSSSTSPDPDLFLFSCNGGTSQSTDP